MIGVIYRLEEEIYMIGRYQWWLKDFLGGGEG